MERRHLRSLSNVGGLSKAERVRRRLDHVAGHRPQAAFH